MEVFVWQFKGFDLNKIKCLQGFSKGSGGGEWGLRLLRMLGVGVKASEVADDAHAVLLRLLAELRQLLGQQGELRRQGGHGQFGRGEVIIMHQLPAALQTLGSMWDLKQKALYRRANVRNWMEKQSETR